MTMFNESKHLKHQRSKDILDQYSESLGTAYTINKRSSSVLHELSRQGSEIKNKKNNGSPVPGTFLFLKED